tara:strand:- start:95 stop:421 length:327 start_codon:yes stop_codon:yes gene_type:complete
MKLMTKEIQNKMPKLYEQEGKGGKAKAYVKYFCPWNHWTWYGFEFDGKDEFFGLVRGNEDELGYFTLSELEKVVHPFGLKIERDLYYTPQTLDEIKAENYLGENNESK